MGEKRAYKPRKPGGGRKKLKPEYDAGKNLKEQMESAVALYNSEMSLQAIADALNLNPIKVRKLLITAGVYESEVAEKVQDTFEEYRKTQNYKDAILSTANILQLSKASVTSYLHSFKYSILWLLDKIYNARSPIGIRYNIFPAAPTAPRECPAQQFHPDPSPRSDLNRGWCSTGVR